MNFYSQTVLNNGTRATGFHQVVGLTLIELLVTMFMALLMIAVGMPGFVTLRQGQAQSAALNQTYGVLQLARSLAMTDATTVVLCTSTNKTSCNGGSNFADGAIIVSETTAGVQTLVRVIEPISMKDFAVQLVGFPTTTDIRFTDIGEIENLAGTASISFCDPRGSSSAAALIVNPLGMVRLATDDDGDNIVNLHTTNNVVCH